MRMSPRLLLAALGAVLVFHAGCSDDRKPCEGEGCDSAPTLCGNGTLEGTEVCDDGNTASGDGCQADCSLTQTRCAAADAPALPDGATCAVTRAGTGARLFTGVVLKDGETLVGGQVLVDAQGVIQCAACDCSAAGGAAEATQVSCPGGVISPGLINPHEHITYPEPPYVPTTQERYEHRHEWRSGKNGHTRITSARSNNSDLVRWAELRQLMAGATSLAGAGGQPGFLRNLDTATLSQQEGLNEGSANSETFPLGDSSSELLASGCAYPSMQRASSLSSSSAFLPHIAEGIADTALNEFRCLSTGENDVIRPRTAIIHGVGLTAKEIALMAERGTGLVWSPRSNVSLYGDTAMVTTYKRMGVSIALGTDWLRSGSMNLLRELQCADYLNATHYARAFSDEQLWRMVTSNGADLTDVYEKTGRIAPGKVADLAIYQLRTFATSPHRAVVTANPEHVVLTMRGGKALFGDRALMDALKGEDTCDTLDVCGAAKSACVQSEIGKTLAALQTSVGDAYPLFACGTPKDEPVCSPRRDSEDSRWPASVNGSNSYTGQVQSEDPDGDGLSGASDNCPTIFNPVRPMDDRKQADSDGDGLGDACDPCPLAAGSACTLFTVGDDDHDTQPTWLDNCPFTANQDQVDADGDSKGDACDACPTVGNPGELGCPATIYDLKTPVGGNLPLLNTPVALSGVLVTAVVKGAASANGYWVQAYPVPAGKSAEYSGLFVYAPKGTLAAGDVLDISTGTLILYNGLLELTDVKYVRRSSGNPLPAPVVVTSADVRTGGPRAAALEGVLVEVRDVAVISALDSFNQFLVSEDGAAQTGLMVDDQVYAYSAAPALGTRLGVLRGVLTYNFNDSKVVPRGPEDLVLPLPLLTGFGPNGFVRLGRTGAVSTFPQALTLTLSGSYGSALDINVTSNNPDALRIPDGRITIPAGQTSAEVRVEPLAQAASVTLTARLGGSERSATVRVLGANEQPELARLNPAAVTMVPGGTVTLTVDLDRPAPANASVALRAEPETGFGTFNVPNGTLALAENATQASFTFTVDEAATMASGTVTASLGGSQASTAVTLDQDAPRLVSVLPSSGVMVPAGGTQAFRVTLNRAPTVDALVALAATPGANVTRFGAVPGTVTVPAGTTEATFLFTADAQGEGNGTVSASLFGITRSATLTVTPPPPKLSAVSPASATVYFNATQDFTVALDRRAPVGGITVNVALEPASGLGSLPGATVLIPEGQTGAPVRFTAGAIAASGRLRVTYEGVTQAAEITVTARPAIDHVVISEVSARGGSTTSPTNETDEFIELHNPTGSDINLSNWKVQYMRFDGTSYSGSVTLPASTVIKAYGYLLLANKDYTGSVTRDVVYSFNMSGSPTGGGHVRIGGPEMNASNLNDPHMVDRVGYGTANQPEGTAAPAHPAAGGSLERKARDTSTASTMGAGGADANAGNGWDTDDNSKDFVVRAVREPQNSRSETERPE